MEYAAYLGQRPHAGGKVVAKTDIQIQLPDGCYGRVAPRSGLAANHHIEVELTLSPSSDVQGVSLDSNNGGVMDTSTTATANE